MTVAVNMVAEFTVTCVEPFAGKLPLTPLIEIGGVEVLAFCAAHVSVTDPPGATEFCDALSEQAGAGTV
jgi:hypothetical protein